MLTLYRHRRRGLSEAPLQRGPGAQRGISARAAAGMLLLVFLTACAPSQQGKGASVAAGGASPDAPVYHDFNDVLIPAALKLNPKESFVVRTPEFSSGVLVFKGRVEPNSLIAFFDRYMTQDNWKLVGAFKSPRTLMLFNKNNRWCVIKISEGDFSTETEVWVSPKIPEAGSGLFK